METLSAFVNLILHMDQHLLTLINHYGSWTYAILFLIIFCETGLIILPFLPGDSLLFAAGTLVANAGQLNIHLLFLLLACASTLGNAVNYSIGRRIGPRVFQLPQSRLFNPQHLERAHRFYESYGGKAIIIARFIPIIRTFAPFVAGVGTMNFARFVTYNCLGTLLWIGGLLYSSYFFGNLPFVKTHFSSVILAIIALSLTPPVLAYLKHRFAGTALSLTK